MIERRGVHMYIHTCMYGSRAAHRGATVGSLHAHCGSEWFDQRYPTLHPLATSPTSATQVVVYTYVPPVLFQQAQYPFTILHYIRITSMYILCTYLFLTEFSHFISHADSHHLQHRMKWCSDFFFSFFLSLCVYRESWSLWAHNSRQPTAEG